MSKKTTFLAAAVLAVGVSAAALVCIRLFDKNYITVNDAQ